MKSLSKAHNKSKRRREDKALLRTLRNPQARELVLRELAARTTPLRKMVK